MNYVRQYKDTRFMQISLSEESENGYLVSMDEIRHIEITPDDIFIQYCNGKSLSISAESL